MANESLFISMALHNWESGLQQAGKLLDSLTDEQLEQPVAPGRNRGIYVVGHLVAIHDALLEVLGLGTRLHAGLEETFVRSPDTEEALMPSVQQLRQYWKDVHERLAEKFAALSPDEWFQKHARVSAEDFAKEPHRNRLNVLLNRTSHLSYHVGQLRFLMK